MMKDDFFEPKLKDEIVSAEEILSRITGIPKYRMKDDKGEYITKSGALQAMEEYANQFKKK